MATADSGRPSGESVQHGACGTCRYLDPIVSYHDDETPESEGVPETICRRFPPTDGWPTVLADDWCGEWRSSADDTPADTVGSCTANLAGVGGHLLMCTLPHGHAGRHRSSVGTEWTEPSHG